MIKYTNIHIYTKFLKEAVKSKLDVRDVRNNKVVGLTYDNKGIICYTYKNDSGTVHGIQINNSKLLDKRAKKFTIDGKALDKYTENEITLMLKGMEVARKQKKS